MTTKSMAERALTGLASTMPGEFEEAVFAMSRLSHTDIFYDVVERAPLETEVFIERTELKVAQIEAELAMHKAALLGAKQALQHYQDSQNPNAAADAIQRIDQHAPNAVHVAIGEPKQLAH